MLLLLPRRIKDKMADGLRITKVVDKTNYLGVAMKTRAQEIKKSEY
jgi:hypothetical protein